MKVTALYPREDRLGLAYIGTAFIAICIGAVFGVVQALVRAGAIPVSDSGVISGAPSNMTYYEFLTAHGIMMALVFTTFFILGFLLSGTARALGEPFSPLARVLGWAGYWLMLGSTVVVAEQVLTNKATVLYTFYAPLQASAAFYIGLTLFIVGSWLGGAAICVAYYRWRRRNKGAISPLFSFMAVATIVLWLEATVGVAIEAIFQLIPWSLGWEPKINVELSRTLFWYFGHPLVYFWLLPAYIAWYAIIPRLIGGHVFSDSLARFAFILLVIFSVPVGVHHELMDTGISSNVKMLQVFLTFCVVVPSLMTAFAVTASLERAGRARGGTGLFGWIFKLPWSDPRFLAPACGMLAFVVGGAGGMVNASYQVDATVHNTLWIVGHFHVTLGTSVVLTYFGISYWMVPMLLGKPLWGRNLAVVQTFVWLAGIALMSGAMHVVGLLGDPRRTASTTYGGSPDSAAWHPYLVLAGIGGSLLGLGVILFMIVMIGTVLGKQRAESDLPLAEAMAGGMPTPALLERWEIWVGLTIVLVIIAYGIPIAQLLQHGAPGSPGFVTW